MSEAYNLIRGAAIFLLLIALVSIVSAIYGLADYTEDQLNSGIAKLEEGIAQIEEQEQVIENIPETKPEIKYEQQEQQATIVINGNVDTGDDYTITHESQKIDYGTTIVIVAAIIVIPLFILGMTILILMHKKAEREHTEKVLATSVSTYREQDIANLKTKYEGGET